MLIFGTCGGQLYFLDEIYERHWSNRQIAAEIKRRRYDRSQEVSYAYYVGEYTEQYTISLSEVISIGDGENDMEMIRRCGCGIAMENGLQELQACADYICPSVSNEGAADAIEYFLGL